MATVPGTTLRSRRLECGLTQAELAQRAGVSRQLVAAVEAGRNSPAVEAAIGLATALGTSVLALFAPTPDVVVAALGGELRDGTPVQVGRVGDGLVTSALSDHGVAGAGWATADGVIEAGELRVFPNATPAGAVLAGCDPALGVAAAMLDGLGPLSLLAISAPTDAARRALELGRVHAAVVHGVQGALPDPPVRVVRLHLACWQVGLAFAPKLLGSSLEALLSGQWPLVQRDPGAASQQAVLRAGMAAGIAALPSGRRAAGHIESARLAAILNCVGVSTESAARAFGLGFLALEDHTVEVWIAEPWSAHPAVNALAELLASAAFTERVAAFGGYDLTRCGQRV